MKKNYLLHIFSVSSSDNTEDVSLSFSSLEELLKKFDVLDKCPFALHEKGVSILCVTEETYAIDIKTLFTHIYP